MRLLPALFFATTVAGAQGAPAVQVGPRLKVVDSLRIDGKKNRLDRGDYVVLIGPRGQVVVAFLSGLGAGFDSLGQRLWQNDWPREIAEVSAIGWRTDGMWVSDRRYGQVALLDSHGIITKSIELPSVIRPTFSNRRTFPVFEDATIAAYLPDGSLIVAPRNPVGVLKTPGFDEKLSYILKVSEDGIIQRTIASFPSVRWAQQQSYETERKGGIKPPDHLFVNNNFWPKVVVAPDGMRTIVVTVDTANPKLDTIRIRAHKETGDTAYIRKFAAPSDRFTEEEVRVMLRNQWSGRFRAEEMEGRVSAFPRRAPTLTDFVLGRDYSVWIMLRETKAGRTVVGFDAVGQPIGTLLLPLKVRVRAADRGLVWVSAGGATDLVRYRYAAAR